MSFYFQPPIFGNYLLPVAPGTIPSSLVVLLPRTTYTSLYWQPAPVTIPVPQYILTSNIKIKIIFHRAGTVLASNDAHYNYTPTRETVLANLAWWSKQHNLGDRVYSGQCTLYTTRSQYSNLSILPDVGPITPADNVRKVSFADQLTANDFQSIMYQISANSYGAFILIDLAYVPLQVLARGSSDLSSSDVTNNASSDLTNAAQTAPHSTRQASPAPPSSPKEPVNTSNDENNGTGNSNTGTQTPLAPVDTDTGSSKGDVTDGSLENIGGEESKQPAVDESVDEEGVANV
ncbi:uncharacterized protein B0J16DRAFT_350698 [Fusarium flagelliforme]|uniref:Uncharacterized protein n=1 Tax=Fusarium flagelliforme TaxID=2675880 RepID=A0A395MFR3_9HYPO|nr:uncharacterized protein B0J16DRAFT_350698 [Fusarium flagelliforme]KAH7173692.1 hypothetical protein B0J16DRAFT_350698 [Fusarium flagelliforme]RFN46113.1 hypothetical protein FIE12Z_9616 [Fusarium flagelliforme]